MQPTETITYDAHRERQRVRIRGAARKLFMEQGIDRSTMTEVIAASGLRASTMYCYYPSKDELVWDLVREELEDACDQARQFMDGAGSGLEKIQRLLGFFAHELTVHADRVRFMAQFDAMYAQLWSVERLLALERQIQQQSFRAFSDLIREGIADGSLRQDLDPDVTLHAVINAVVGAQRRLASLGDKVEAEYGQPVGVLFGETIRILIQGLQAPTTPALRAKSTPRKKVL